MQVGRQDPQGRPIPQEEWGLSQPQTAPNRTLVTACCFFWCALVTHFGFPTIVLAAFNFFYYCWSQLALQLLPTRSRASHFHFKPLHTFSHGTNFAPVSSLSIILQPPAHLLPARKRRQLKSLHHFAFDILCRDVHYPFLPTAQSNSSNPERSTKAIQLWRLPIQSNISIRFNHSLPILFTHPLPLSYIAISERHSASLFDQHYLSFDPAHEVSFAFTTLF